MKNIIFIAFVILGMTSCKTTQTKTLVGYQDVPTNKCYINQEIVSNKVDTRGNLILDANGNPIKVATGRYRKVEVPCFRLDSTFVGVDTNNDGRDDVYDFLQMDTIYLANAVPKEETTTVPTEIIRPSQTASTNVVTTNGAIYTRTRPTAGYYRYYYGFTPYYSPRRYWPFYWLRW